MKREVCFLVPHGILKNPLEPFHGLTEDGAGSMRNGEISFCTEQTTEANWLFVASGASDDFYTLIPRERRILFLMEPPDIKIYALSFLNQFGILVSPYNIPAYKGTVLLSNPCLGWFAGVSWVGGDGSSDNKLFKTLSDVINFRPPLKHRKISIVASLKKKTRGHRDRIALLNALKGEFGDAVDYYGREFAPVDDKIDAIAPYRYHIAIENSSHKNYWTEKLADAWIGWSVPIYWGDPTILDQIPNPKGIEIIGDIADTRAALGKIRSIMENDDYESRLPALEECRNWVINKANSYEKVCSIIEGASNETREAPRLQREEYIKCHTFLQRARRKLRSLFGVL